MSAEQVQAIAAMATFFAAALAVWAAFRAPKLAAKFAENLRSSNLKIEEERRQKVVLFGTLLEHRGSLGSFQSVSAVNLTDLIYASCPDVRNARKDFMEAAKADPFEFIALYERYLALIGAMARELGLDDRLTIADIRSAWLPKNLGEQAELEFLERQSKLEALRNRPQV
jgi:hypothetical protein